MTTVEPDKTRQFALWVVRRLREAGHQALWAGGCVRDQLLGLVPTDYDVATDAPPDEVRRVFGHRKTRAIGASFGVITVLGPRDAGQLDVATFRRDATYSDGRHPDAVSFSTPEEDARRRDFTINGLFFDPLEGRVIDHVGGVADLGRRVVRAIGDPEARFDEDKLRMLRAVRFAATFAFELDVATADAIGRHADELVIVSAERVAAEMRRMLVHANRADAVRLLAETRLLPVLLPEARALGLPEPPTEGLVGEGDPAESAWRRTLRVLHALDDPEFATALAALLRDIAAGEPRELAETVARRWRLSNDEGDTVAWLLAHEPFVCNAPATPWPKLQRVLASPKVGELLKLAEAVAAAAATSSAGIELCRAKLALPAAVWNPPPLVTGDDLIRRGFQPGPEFKDALDAVRDAQLLGRVQTRDEALALAQSLLHRRNSP